MKNRNSNIELLRLIAMLMILLSHSSVHGGFPHENSAIMFNNFFLDAIVLGNIGVDIFFLISGYFLCYQTTLNYSALFRLLFQVLFYSIICYGIHLSIGNNFVLKEARCFVSAALTQGRERESCSL